MTVLIGSGGHAIVVAGPGVARWAARSGSAPSPWSGLARRSPGMYLPGKSGSAFLPPVLADHEA